MRIVLSALKCQKTLRFNILCVLILTLSSIGCGNKGGSMLLRDCKALSATMDQADHIMNDNPQLAYNLLDSIDCHSIWSRKEKARYALLYTEAQYKNYQPIESDSLIMTSVKYYSHSKNPELLFRSYYTLGCVYSLFECYNDAAVAFAQAEKLVDYETSDFRKGLLFSHMGKAYYDTYDYARAEPLFSKAIDYFSKTDNDYYMISSKGLAANCRSQQSDYLGAIRMYNEVIDWSRSNDNLELMNTYMTNKVSNYVYAEKLDSAGQVLDNIIAKFGLPDSDPDALYRISRYYIATGDIKNARKVLDMAWNNPPADSTNLLLAESLFYDKMGQKDSALIYYKQSMALNNAIARKMLEKPVISAQRDYYRAISEVEELEVRNKATMLIAAIIILILTVISYTFYNLNRKRKTNEQIRNYLYAIDELTARDTLSQTKIQILNSQVRYILRQQFLPSDYLFTRYYEQIDDARKAERLYKVVKTQIDDFTNSRNIDRLDTLINEAYGGLMDKLLSAHLNLQDKELLHIRFVLSGFSAKSIAAILNDSHQNINQRKKRLLEKIGRLDAGLLVELNAALSSK